MAYTFKGRLCGLICAECPEPLSRVRVRLYRHRPDQPVIVLAVANPKDTFALLDDGTVQAKAELLIAEAETDDDGNFTFVLGEKEQYDGGPFEIDLYLESIAGRKGGERVRPRQATLTTLQPLWRTTEQGAIWAWEYCLPQRWWCALLALFDIWTICGHVTVCDSKRPAVGLRVFVFDADWIQDDVLGSAVTDASGAFRISYTSADFKKTPWSPSLNLELFGGPDIYFRIETLSGTVLLAEPQARGRAPDRENVGNCFCVDLCVDHVPVDLTCAVTQPTGCKHGDATLLPPQILEPIVGTASGTGFDHYELELFWSGMLAVPGAIIYANAMGIPDTSLTTGANQVVGGTLGFVDLQQATLGVGMNILTNTNFEVRLHVVGVDASRHTCTTNFAIGSARAFIKYVGGAWAPDVVDPNEPLRLSDSAAAALATVGGSISVRGAADAYGCDDEKIAEYSLWVKADATFAEAQPANGTAFDATANGWTNITTVVYTTDAQRIFNDLNGMPNPSFLTNQPVWSTRTVCSIIDSSPPICFSVPDLVEFYWPSGTSGKYSLLVKVVDTDGNTYYDVQRVWIDNEVLRGKISFLRYHGSSSDIPSCTDILVNDGAGVARQLDIRGFATDPLIVAGDLTQPTSDNFATYNVALRKQGAAGEVLVITSTAPVPNRAMWSGGASDPPDDLLATLDLTWIDKGTPAPNDANGIPIAPDQRLVRGTSCSYDIILRASDKTIVSESTHHTVPGGFYSFPVKIVNDLP